MTKVTPTRAADIAVRRRGECPCAVLPIGRTARVVTASLLRVESGEPGHNGAILSTSPRAPTWPGTTVSSSTQSLLSATETRKRVARWRETGTAKGVRELSGRGLPGGHHRDLDQVHVRGGVQHMTDLGRDVLRPQAVFLLVPPGLGAQHRVGDVRAAVRVDGSG